MSAGRPRESNAQCLSQKRAEGRADIHVGRTNSTKSTTNADPECIIKTQVAPKTPKRSPYDRGTGRRAGGCENVGICLHVS